MSCDSFIVCAQHGTMVLVMCPLRGEMRQRPRYWQRLFAVLCATLQGAHLPAVVLQVAAVWGSCDSHVTVMCVQGSIYILHE